MSRQYNIRWQQSDNEDLRKAVKNFNAKIKRLEEKNPQNKNVLPNKVTVRQMKELIETRQDLNREINALKRFTKRGAEEIVNIPNNDYNLQTTKWQKEEMTRRVGIINRKRKKRLEEIQATELKSRGQDLGYTKGQLGMGKAEEIALSPMKAFSRKMTRYDLRYKFENIKRESQTSYWHKRDLLLKANYIKSLEENFNPNDIKHIVEAIDKMDFKEFRKKFEQEGGNFELSYPPDKESQEKYIKALESTWTPNKGKDEGANKPKENENSATGKQSQKPKTGKRLTSKSKSKKKKR